MLVGGDGSEACIASAMVSVTLLQVLVVVHIGGL